MNTITIFKGTSEEKTVDEKGVENLCLNYQDLYDTYLDLRDELEAYKKVRMGL